MIHSGTAKLTWLRTIGCLCVLFVPLFLQQGCVSTTLQEVKEASAGIGAAEAIAILGRRNKTQDETESKFVDCVSDKTSSGEGAINVVADDDFIDAMFPWFEPRYAPIDIADMSNLLKNRKVAAQIKDIGVKYIVWIEGITERKNQSGRVQCAVATGFMPACFGFLSWETGSDYEATVWDIEKGITVGKLSSESKGMSFVPAVVVVIPFIARTQAHACTSMSGQLKSFIGE